MKLQIYVGKNKLAKEKREEENVLNTIRIFDRVQKLSCENITKRKKTSIEKITLNERGLSLILGFFFFFQF